MAQLLTPGTDAVTISHMSKSLPFERGRQPRQSCLVPFPVLELRAQNGSGHDS